MIWNPRKGLPLRVISMNHGLSGASNDHGNVTPPTHSACRELNRSVPLHAHKPLIWRQTWGISAVVLLAGYSTLGVDTSACKLERGAVTANEESCSVR